MWVITSKLLSITCLLIAIFSASNFGYYILLNRIPMDIYFIFLTATNTGMYFCYSYNFWVYNTLVVVD